MEHGFDPEFERGWRRAELVGVSVMLLADARPVPGTRCAACGCRTPTHAPPCVRYATVKRDGTIHIIAEEDT
jgi:hypothetical protein